MRLASVLSCMAPNANDGGPLCILGGVFHKTVPSSFASSASGTPVLHAAAGLLSPFVSPQISELLF